MATFSQRAARSSIPALFLVAVAVAGCSTRAGDSARGAFWPAGPIQSVGPAGPTVAPTRSVGMTGPTVAPTRSVAVAGPTVAPNQSVGAAESSQWVAA